MGHKTVFPWDSASKQRAENFYVLAEEFVVLVVHSCTCTTILRCSFHSIKTLTLIRISHVFSPLSASFLPAQLLNVPTNVCICTNKQGDHDSYPIFENIIQ